MFMFNLSKAFPGVPREEEKNHEGEPRGRLEP